MRIRTVLTILSLASLAGAPALGADKSSSGPAKKSTPASAAAAAQNSCRTCTERRPVLDPKLFTDVEIYGPEAKPAYQAARAMPATIDKLHCFCECAESPQFHHKTLLTCFADNHAAGCGICIKEALLASELKQKGASDQEIIKMVESMFKTDGHPPTHRM
jgi:hypothetical protein